MTHGEGGGGCAWAPTWAANARESVSVTKLHCPSTNTFPPLGSVCQAGGVISHRPQLLHALSLSLLLSISQSLSLTLSAALSSCCFIFLSTTSQRLLILSLSPSLFLVPLGSASLSNLPFPLSFFLSLFSVCYPPFPSSFIIFLTLYFSVLLLPLILPPSPHLSLPLVAHLMIM